MPQRNSKRAFLPCLEEGNTALLHAACERESAVLQKLLDAGADVKHVNKVSLICENSFCCAVAERNPIMRLYRVKLSGFLLHIISTWVASAGFLVAD